jgi:hypothetical protein
MFKALAIIALAFNVLPVQAYTPQADKPSAPIAWVAPQNMESKELQAEAKNHIDADVRVISTPAKDGYDKAAFWFSVTLVVVGILGVGIGIGTLLFLRSQTAHIKRQADVMKEQSDLMVEKERAKLRIELDEFHPVNDEHETYWVKGHVSIYGNTEAFIERTEIYASIGAAGIFNPLPEWLWGMHLPAVIRSTAEAIPVRVMVMASDGPTTDEEILPVREAKEFVYVMAKVEFADAFGRKWVLRLRRRFRFIWSDIESPGSGGSWEDSGPTSDNGEYRVEA